MASVIVSRAACEDLLNIQKYIRDDLMAPDAAKHILSTLRTAIESLETFPERGKSLDRILYVHTGFRFLVCEHYRIFYLTDGEKVEIVRILHMLQNYMQVLF